MTDVNAVLRALDKHDRLGPDGVRALLAEGRRDGSGAFTPGCDLEPWQIEKLMALLALAPRIERGHPARGG